MSEPIRLGQGQAVYHPDAGAVPEGTTVLCGVCGTGCAAEREAGVSYGRRYDRFFCVYADKAWHRQAAELQELAGSTPSPTLAAIYTFDAVQVLRRGLRGVKLEEGKP